MNQYSPDLKNLQAVIFDLDGVLFDSHRAIMAFFNYLLEYVGLPPRAEQEAAVLFSSDLQTSLLHLMGPGDNYRRALEHWEVMDSSRFIKEMQMMPHVPDTLEHLTGRFRLALATNRTRTTPLVLNHFGISDFFELVITPHDSQEPKPAPHMMELTLNGLGLQREQVVYVGDSRIDEGFCQASGVPLVAYANPSLKAWAHVDDFRQIPPLLGLD